jgi:hypothetical protein
MTNRSPAAQAVLDAYWDDAPLESGARYGLAAALRAVADQVVPETEEPRSPFEYDLGLWDARDDVRNELLAIAAALEALSQ